MNNTAQIRQLLQRKIVAAKIAALHTNDFLIPVEDRYLISMSIQEVEQILTIIPCETCNGTGQINRCRGRLCFTCPNRDPIKFCHPYIHCPDCQPS